MHLCVGILTTQLTLPGMNHELIEVDKLHMLQFFETLPPNAMAQADLYAVQDLLGKGQVVVATSKIPKVTRI